jgi:hypothetical protein
MNTIIRDNVYTDFFDSLQKVCAECEVDVEKDIQKEPEILNLQTVTEKINRLIPDKLIAYEAAKRVGKGAKPIVKYYLEAWATELDAKVKATFGPINAKNPSLDNVEVQLDEIMRESKWPSLLNPKSYKSIRTYPQHPFSRELVYLKYLKKQDPTVFPKFVKCFMFKGKPSPFEEYLIQKYSSYPLQLTFSEIDRVILDDKAVQLLFKRFTNLKSIDLTDCHHITHLCLQVGHRTLEEINLTNTPIVKKQIYLGAYPKMKEAGLLDNSPNTTCKLGSFNDMSSWRDIVSAVECSHLLFASENNLSFLVLKFSLTPTGEGLVALLTLEKHFQKKLHHLLTTFYKEKLIKSLITTWENLPEEAWNSEECLGQKILETFNKYYGFDSWLIIRSAFLKKLSFAQEWNKNFEIPRDEWNEGRYIDQIKKPELIACLKPGDMERIRALLIFFYKNWYEKSINISLFEKLKPAIKFIHTELIHDFSSEMHKDTLSRLELFNEVYVESSYYVAVYMGLYTNFKHLKKKVSERALIHTLISTFLLKRSDKQDCLSEILHDVFSDSENFSIMSKLILGMVQEKDIPSHLKGSVFEWRMREYKGIFNEKISEQLKADYWSGLCQGQFGGINTKLIDGLVLFHQFGTPDEWQGKAFDALKNMSENGSIEKDIQDYAKENLKNLIEFTQ